MSEKWFELKFIGNPKLEYVQGKSIQEAFSKAGYEHGAAKVLDYYNETSVLPFEAKPVFLIDDDNGEHEISRDTMFCKQILPKLITHISMHEVKANVDCTICKHHYDVLATIYPLKIVLEIMGEREV